MPASWQPGGVDQFQAALVEEATRKSGVIWIAVRGAGPSRPAWHIWHATNAQPTRRGDDPARGRRGAAYVVTGDKEQSLPGLGDARQVTVTVPSKDTRGRLIVWTAEVGRVAPDSGEWAAVADLLAARRRGGTEPLASLPERWAARAAVFRLTPVDAVTDETALAREKDATRADPGDVL